MIVGVVSPKTINEQYGVDAESLNKQQLGSTRGCSYQILAMAVFVLCLLGGVDPHRALGYASVPGMAHCAHFLFGDEELPEEAKSKVVLWLLFHGASFYALGLKE